MIMFVSTRTRMVMVSANAAYSDSGKGDLPTSHERSSWPSNDKVSCGPTVWPSRSISLSIEAAGESLGHQLCRRVYVEIGLRPYVSASVRNRSPATGSGITGRCLSYASLVNENLSSVSS
jgi:hypothetical protein